jgi:UDP-N-acetylglucosamine 2-epimerase (non-hydrolysing)
MRKVPVLPHPSWKAVASGANEVGVMAVATVLSLFGTRPEVIKLAPVISSLEAESKAFKTINVASGQHDELAAPFVCDFGIRIDHRLGVMTRGQSPNGVCARVLSAVDPILGQERPDVVLVQGDTTTALAGALAAHYRRVPVGHVEAGLRSGDPLSPFPEEMNRRLISQVATWHFAATALNRQNLLRESVAEDKVFVTGNPVVDALQMLLSRRPRVQDPSWLVATEGLRRIVLTTHRRESFGTPLFDNLLSLRRFVERHADAALLFPVHPNPVVVDAARQILSGHPRIHLLEPLGYVAFLSLLSRAYLIVSDSGGVQEEAPSLGRPLLVLRDRTERPEALASGLARLVGGSPMRLASMLEEAWQPGSWAESATVAENPFGRGDAGRRIVEALASVLGRRLRGGGVDRADGPKNAITAC